MIPEAWFIHLACSVRERLPADRSEAVLRRAGAATADYVATHRIPAPLRGALRALPVRLAIPLLLRAFERHAWTFAGGGRFTYGGAFPGTLTLAGASTCRGDAAGRVGRPAGAFYEAAFEGLLRLASPAVRVREVACQALRDPLCLFEITLSHPIQPPPGAPCASS
jgi:divinyl protochlorophyllide a 8-vinyl-reductase